MKEPGKSGPGGRDVRGRAPGGGSTTGSSPGGPRRGGASRFEHRPPPLSRAPAREPERIEPPSRDLPRADPREPGAERRRRVETDAQLGWRDWKAVLLRVKEQVGADNISITAAGMAFYFMLSIVPALLAAVSIYGMVSDPAAVERQVSQVAEVVPEDAMNIVQGQLRDLVSSSKGGLSIGAAVSVLLALWSASKGAKAMITGINIAYDEPETRKSWRVQTLALVFTFGFVAFGIVSLALIAFFPWLFERLAAQVGIGPLGEALAYAARWVLLLAAVVVALALAYRYAPNHREPCWRCVRWGAAVASLLWLVASMGFSWYASSFGSFNETYGSLAGIVVLLLWLDISAYVVLLGAEISAELEEQLGVAGGSAA